MQGVSAGLGEARVAAAVAAAVVVGHCCGRHAAHTERSGETHVCETVGAGGGGLVVTNTTRLVTLRVSGLVLGEAAACRNVSTAAGWVGQGSGRDIILVACVLQDILTSVGDAIAIVLIAKLHARADVRATAMFTRSQALTIAHPSTCCAAALALEALVRKLATALAARRASSDIRAINRASGRVGRRRETDNRAEDYCLHQP
mmetsp:Transcript_38417/g.63634  ORF Transcript_38417/g.63634 Transcript_38417/m.63634 type:complete len:203 (-) Transcript_38417:8-616(-)